MLPRVIAWNACYSAKGPYHEEALRLRGIGAHRPLTQLYNTGHFREALAQEMERTGAHLITYSAYHADLFLKR